MIQATLHIDSKKKWAAVKIILEAMDIAYDAQESVTEISKKEQGLLQRKWMPVCSFGLPMVGLMHCRPLRSRHLPTYSVSHP